MNFLLLNFLWLSNSLVLGESKTKEDLRSAVPRKAGGTEAENSSDKERPHTNCLWIFANG